MSSTALCQRCGTLSFDLEVTVEPIQLLLFSHEILTVRVLKISPTNMPNLQIKSTTYRLKFNTLRRLQYDETQQQPIIYFHIYFYEKIPKSVYVNRLGTENFWNSNTRRICEEVQSFHRQANSLSCFRYIACVRLWSSPMLRLSERRVKCVQCVLYLFIYVHTD